MGSARVAAVAMGMMGISAAALAAGGAAGGGIADARHFLRRRRWRAPASTSTKVPAAVAKVISAQAIEREKSPTVVRALTQQTPSVDIQTPPGNDLEPDVLFRGFDASPVEGTPQGLAVYQNGVRINEAFGDTVIGISFPPSRRSSIEVVSNNPAFGLNALGGAVSMKMKDGFNFQGTTLDVMGGTFGRAQASLQWGKQVGPWAAYIAIDGAHDGGYRRAGGTDLRRVYGDIGYKAERSEFHLSAGGAQQLLRRRRDLAVRIAAAGLGQHLHLAADVAQSGRLRQRHRRR